MEGDAGQIRIGTAGTHTNVTFAGIINGNGSGLTNNSGNPFADTYAVQSATNNLGAVITNTGGGRMGILISTNGWTSPAVFGGNTIIGLYAPASSNQIGDDVSGYGIQVLEYATTNTVRVDAFGASALRQASNVTDSSAFGRNSLVNLQNGSNVLAFGESSGSGVTRATNSI